MKLETAINNAYQKLKNNNIKSALIDSEIIIANVINKSREYVVLNSNEVICKKDLNKFEDMINQRSVGKPVAYLIQKKFFWKDEFFIDNNVLIPRPDTETIIEQVLKIYKNRANINFLDIGFGSGCILLSILKERGDFRATGVDISSYALKVCQIVRSVGSTGEPGRVAYLGEPGPANARPKPPTTLENTVRTPRQA